MSVREIKDKPIYKHEAQALLFVHPEDFTSDEITGLEERYPGIVEEALKILANPKFEKGVVAKKVWGKDDTVLFACISREDPGYKDLKSILLKVVESKAKGITHVAVGYPGSSMGSKRIHINAIEDYLRLTSEKADFVFDFHNTRQS